MKNTWDEEVGPHRTEDCYPCKGSRVYKLPLGAPDDGREIEDEANCYCDCHRVYLPRYVGKTPTAMRGAADKVEEVMG